MPKALEDLMKNAMELDPDERLVLADLLIESAFPPDDVQAGAAWEKEIRDRMQAIEAGLVGGVAYEDVMREADQRLAE